MKKFFQNKYVAIALTVAVIAGCLVYGQLRKPDTTVSESIQSVEPAQSAPAEYSQWSSDEAGILSDSTLQAVENYNAKWDSNYGVIVALLVFFLGGAFFHFRLFIGGHFAV